MLQGQKDYGRCLRLSPCCVASSSSSPDSVKGAALRSNSRYTSSQSRRATANRQVGFSSPPPTPPLSHNFSRPSARRDLVRLPSCLPSRVASGGCGTTRCADRPSRPSSPPTSTTRPLSTEVRAVVFFFSLLFFLLRLRFDF